MGEVKNGLIRVQDFRGYSTTFHARLWNAKAKYFQLFLGLK